MIDFEKQLHDKLVAASEEARNKFGYNPTRFLRMLSEKGAYQTATELVMKPDVSDGITRLWEEQRLDLSLEAIILQEPWCRFLPTEVLESAQRKLEELGYAPSIYEKPNGEPRAWTEVELTAAIRAYFQMLKSEQLGQTYNKSEVNRQLRSAELANRTQGAVELRMQNISSVLDDLGIEWINGYKPMKNVGENVRTVIEQIIFDNGFLNRKSFEPTVSDVELDDRVKSLSKYKLKRKPRGIAIPKKSETSTTIYYRDPVVKAWILQNANGVCELCNAQAPFAVDDGTPYLEVHHVKTLADDGSDKVENAVALCPNCHRACHYSLQRNALSDKLYAKINRLIRE